MKNKYNCEVIHKEGERDIDTFTSQHPGPIQEAVCRALSFAIEKTDGLKQKITPKDFPISFGFMNDSGTGVFTSKAGSTFKVNVKPIQKRVGRKFNPDKNVGDNTNAVRATRGEGSLHHYVRVELKQRGAITMSELADLLCDLMHMSDREKINFDEALADAKNNHEEEA